MKQGFDLAGPRPKTPDLGPKSGVSWLESEDRILNVLYDPFSVDIPEERGSVGGFGRTLRNDYMLQRDWPHILTTSSLEKSLPEPNTNFTTNPQPPQQTHATTHGATLPSGTPTG